MTDRVKEQLSALVDESLSAREQDLLVARMARDEALREHWDRYHLISDAIRSHLPERVAPQLSHRVAAALESEPAHSRTGARRGAAARWLRPLAGVAVAASVAMVAVLVMQQPPPQGADTVQVAEVATTPAADDYRRLEGTQWRGEDGQRVSEKLNQYLVNHNEFAARNGVPAMTPHVRIVGYDQGRR